MTSARDKPVNDAAEAKPDAQVASPEDAATAPESGGLPDRQARLAALKSRRAASAGAAGPKRVPLALGPRGAAARDAGGAGPQQFRKQMVMRVYKMLTRTSDDGSGMVPGTPFTKAGVTELMTVLRERAANEGAPGAKIAANAISFLKPVEADEESVAGASVTKLQLIARMASRFGGPAQ